MTMHTVCMYTYVCINMYVYIYMYTYVCIHMYAYICVHMQGNMQGYMQYMQGCRIFLHLLNINFFDKPLLCKLESIKSRCVLKPDVVPGEFGI